MSAAHTHSHFHRVLQVVLSSGVLLSGSAAMGQGDSSSRMTSADRDVLLALSGRVADATGGVRAAHAAGELAATHSAFVRAFEAVVLVQERSPIGKAQGAPAVHMTRVPIAVVLDEESK